MKLRLVKVICQPVFVLDDGETLTEHAAEPMVVPASEWPSYATGTFLLQVAALQAEISERVAEDHSGQDHGPQ
jgi:hypothetical protein